MNLKAFGIACNVVGTRPLAFAQKTTAVRILKGNPAAGYPALVNIGTSCPAVDETFASYNEPVWPHKYLTIGSPNLAKKPNGAARSGSLPGRGISPIPIKRD